LLPRLHAHFTYVFSLLTTESCRRLHRMGYGC
jgi:hypothetical protein